MAKVRYTLTTDQDHVTTEVVDGKTVLVFEWDCEDHYVEDADSSGNYQSDALWEIFKHSFEAFDDDGTPVEYDPHTSERINPTSLDEKEIKTIEHVRRWFALRTSNVSDVSRWFATRTSTVTDVSRMTYSGGVMSFVTFDDRIQLRVDTIWGGGWTKKWKKMSGEDFAVWVGNRVKLRITELRDYDVSDKKFR